MTNWFSPDSTPSDPATFNYDVSAQKLARQRAAAQYLQQLSLGSNQGQFVSNNAGTFYAGGNNLATTAARILGAYMSAKANSAADDSQKQLDLDSQYALQYQLDPTNSVAGKAAMAQQQQVEDNAQLDRETARMQSAAAVNNPGYTDPQAAEYPPIRQDGKTTPVPLPPIQNKPVSKAVVQAAAKALAAAPAPAVPSASPDVGDMLATNPDNPTGMPLSDQLKGVVGFFKKAYGLDTPSAPAAAPTPPAPAAMPTPVVPAAQAPTPALASMPAPMAQTNTFQPVGQAQVQQAQPAAPADPTLTPQQQLEVAIAQQRTAQGLPVSDSRTSMQQAAAQGAANATFPQQLAQLQAIARTGPMGQQTANAMQQAMFSKDWAEIKNADGATVGVYNKRDPNQVIPFQGMASGGVKLADADAKLRGNVDPTNPQAVAQYNQWRQQNGMPPIDAATIAGSNMPADQRATQNQKLTEAHATNQNALSAIDDQVARLNRMQDLYNNTWTGPVVGHLPDWTNDRQELASLTGQNNFAAVRNAVDGAGGGSQRFTQSELQHFAEGNGGLSLDTKPDVAKNLIAQQLSLLQAKRAAIAQADAQLGASTPTAIIAPPRGQTFTGPSATFASRFGGQ